MKAETMKPFPPQGPWWTAPAGREGSGSVIGGLGLGLNLEVPQNIDVKVVKEALGFRSAGCFGHEKS